MIKKLPYAVRAAFPLTIPVMTGFAFLGIAYGVLMSENGFGVQWILLTSSVVFAGALQFVGISLLTAVFDPLNAFMIALAINARHLFYGISMLRNLNDTGKVKPYLAFAMCDETFSILVSAQPPNGVDKRAFMLSIALLNQLYWVTGSVIGGLVGPLLIFDTYGIDFVMTAFFVVIFINTWRAHKSHSSSLIGLGAALLSLIVFGSQNFIVPAMIIIVICLTVFRKQLSVNEEVE